MRKYFLTLASLFSLSGLSLRAASSAADAARLGKDLTPLGGEMAGNADGSIPAWKSAITTPIRLRVTSRSTP